MKTKLVYGLLLCFFNSSLAFAEQAAFEYIGLDINTTVKDLHKRYPNSNDQTTEETKSYYIWVSKIDVKGGVYHIDLREGKEYWPKNKIGVAPKLIDFKWLKLGFEKPDNLLEVKPKTWEDSHYFRMPTCEPILTSLTEKYGKPTVANKVWEERIEHQFYDWQSGEETMRLGCYKLDGKGISLALDVVLSKPIVGLSK